MAIFNEVNQIRETDLTGASRGMPTNRAFEFLFEGLGEAVKVGAEAADTTVQEDIADDVYKIYDETNADFGLDAAVVQSQDAMGKTPTMPQEIADAEGHWNLLSRAAASGKLKPMHYWGRLENEVKALRQKYPGYRPQIDNIVSSITGATPANALRASLMSELDAAQEGKSNDMKFIDANSDHLSPASYQRVLSGEVSVTEAKLEIQRNRSKKETLAVGAAELAAEAALGKNVSDKAITYGATLQSEMTNAMWQDITKGIGKDFNQFRTKVKQFWENDKVLDATEQEELMRLHSGLLSTHSQMLDEIWSKPGPEGQSLMGMASNRVGDMNALKDQSKSEFKTVLDSMMTAEGSGILTLNAATISAMQTSEGAKLLRDHETIRRVSGAKAAGVGDFINAAVAATPNFFTDITTALTGALLAETAAPPPNDPDAPPRPLQEQLGDLRKLEEKQQGAATRFVWQNTINLATSDEVDPSVSARAAGVLFKPDNNDFLKNFDQKDWMTIFGMMVSPNMTKKMIKLGKEYPETFTNYRNWVLDKFPKMFQKDATDAARLSQTTHGVLTALYNEETSQVDVIVKTEGIDEMSLYADPTSLRMATDTAQAQLSNLNKYLRLVDPILQEMGENNSDFIYQLFQSVGADLKVNMEPEGEAPPSESSRDEDDRLGQLRATDATFQLASFSPDEEDEDTDLGSISAEFESGGRGVTTVSSGRGDPGGVSYGAHQLASKTGTMSAFLESPHATAYAPMFEGTEPGTEAFNELYKTVAESDPEGFAQAQKDFITEKHYSPVESFAADAGFTTEDRAIQEALFSMGVQHGGAKKIVKAAAKLLDDDPTVDEQVEALYAARSAYVKRLRKLPKKTKRSVLSRYRREQAKVMALASM
jgi:hypothetical protein